MATDFPQLKMRLIPGERPDSPSAFVEKTCMGFSVANA